MFFKKLELVGFKSFCDKTILHFEPGITAVVGPNGCGKSNIFDSIRWVLGEQSAKSLRGSDMQDVIFNGTDNKEALGMAEVTLTFDNKNRFFNFDNDELAVTRRLFRSGESEYLINKSTTRLKDILDLLMGTGVGAESYSIVAQGKIDLVLSSRPEDRRLIFDEASGITKYKTQKREATRKLDETEQNLLRVNDIINEVKRQIGSLERQANKARKYKEVFEELKSKEINYALTQKQELLKDKDAVIAELGELGAKEAELLKVIQEQEAKINNRQVELRAYEENIMKHKNEIMGLENTAVRNKERINFNLERITELNTHREFLEGQSESIKAKLLLDEKKLTELRSEYEGLRGQIDSKGVLLREKDLQINELGQSIKKSLENISGFKKNIMELASKIAVTKNEISDTGSKKQIYSSRKKRLEIERAKVHEEKIVIEEDLNNVTQEVESVRKMVEESNSKIGALRGQMDESSLKLADINSRILNLEREKLTLESHKDFLEKLKTKYEDIGESMNALIYLDKVPQQDLSGLVIKIKEQFKAGEGNPEPGQMNIKLSGEAKPIELDTRNIQEKIQKLQESLNLLQNDKAGSENRIDELKQSILNLQEELRTHELTLANKETNQKSILEQFNKIKEEQDIIAMELQEVDKEMGVLENNLLALESGLSDLNKQEKFTQDSIAQEEENILKNSKEREGLLVVITQTKTELDDLNRRVSSDEATLRLLEETYKHDRDSLENLEKQIADDSSKKDSLSQEIKDCEAQINASNTQIPIVSCLLKEAELKYQEVSVGSGDITNKIDSDRKHLDQIKNKLYELQMRDKDIEYKYSSIKERMLASYKVDLETVAALPQESDPGTLPQELEKLKERLDSYGNVNLVAIEEYDELKVRYDFLIQQQTDLVTAKESLHQAILKINRTTKQMFLETFENVRLEFRNYFRMLFNGGDAQVFLIDEQDPLESGIEIICRPPGKKLQNVLLLSGGEKSMAAIALIFAIFKVKPSPFCVLDEIDAALDEANVDRFSRVLQEFSKISQFIVITHNKKTIANANVMYGITMQQSGVSKIVSVKFAENNKKNEEEDRDLAAEPA